MSLMLLEKTRVVPWLKPVVSQIQLLFDRGTSRRGLLMSVTLCLVMLAACADDSDDRQFAGDQPSVTATLPITPTTEVGLTETSPIPMASPLSSSDLLVVRGDASGVAVANSSTGVVQYYDVKTESLRTIWSSQEWLAWDSELAADGSVVAILAHYADTLTKWQVILVGVDNGEELGRIEIKESRSEGASDAVTSGTGGLSWSETDEFLAVALPTGGIYRVTIDGDVDMMSAPSKTPNPGGLEWSPTGGAIAFADTPAIDTGNGLKVSATAALPLDPVTLVRPDNSGNRSVETIVWPAGSRIYTLVGRYETGSRQGDIMSIESFGGTPSLEWSSGIGSPGGGAQAFSVSPDGKVLAIVTGSSTGDSRLVIRERGGSVTHVFPLPGEVVAAEFGWTADGIVVAGILYGDQAAFALTVTPSGELDLVEQDATGVDIEGTPVASPVAIPAASPNASPEASPGASPVAAGSPDSDG